MIALVTGATGFVGREVVRELCSRGVEVRCLVRTPGRERVLAGKTVDIRYGSTRDPVGLRAALNKVDAVVNLVAIIRERGEATFDEVNRKGTENLVLAAKHEGVKHFVQISAIGAADDQRYPYLYSKWQGEQAVIGSGIPYTILRASLLFGEGDEFTNTLAGVVRVFPLVPIAGSGRSRFQPLAVREGARCLADAVERDELKGRTVEIGGPDHLSYNDIVDAIARTYRVRRLKLHVPLPIMRLAVKLMEKVVPRPLATTQQLRMIAIPNIAGLDTVEQVFGFKPRPFEGNIGFIEGITFLDGLRIVLGFMPGKIRDH